MMTEAIVVQQSEEMSVEQLQSQVVKVQQVMKAVMKDGHHYGKIPGCGPKPTLLKPGAEKLGFTFRLAPTFEIETSMHNEGHREYMVTCTLTHINTGSIWGSGVGCCSTLEKKYRNVTPADVYNTVLKIAKKRAHVDAVLTSLSVSDIFTQDLEHIGKGDAVITELEHEVENDVTVIPGPPIPLTSDPNMLVFCPECGADAIIKGKEEYGGGWLCFNKKGGCGMKWDHDPRIIVPHQKKTEPLIGLAERSFIFEVAKNGGVSQELVMEILRNFGYSLTEEVKQKDYQDILARIEALVQLQSLKQ